MRRIDLTFTALLLPLDFCAFLLAALTAYALRFSKAFTDIRPILQSIPFSEYLSLASFFALVWMVLFALAGLYRTRERKAWNELGRIILASTAGVMVLIAIVFFRREVTTSRFLVLAVWGFAIVYVWLMRLSLRVIRHELLRAKIGHQRIAIVGNGRMAEELSRLYAERPMLGYSVIASIPAWHDAARKTLERLVAARSIDGVLLADPDMPKAQALDLIAFAESHHLALRYLADLFAASFTNIEVTADGGVPIIEVKRTPLDGWSRITKRAFDIIMASLILIAASPFIAFFAIGLILEDGLPVIFQNTRVGERGQPFKTYKLRSMWRKYSIGPQFQGDEKSRLALERQLIQEKSIKHGPLYKIADDPRVTPIGRFIRRWSIDELPQFWNVLKGDMSIVGPRPHQPREVDQYEPQQRRVLAIKPGITGLAQISGRSDLEFEDEIRLDTFYIENWSLWLDLYILLKTPFAVIQRKGAY